MKKRSLGWKCRICQEIISRWAGVCPHCSEWNTLEEMISPQKSIPSLVRLSQAQIEEPKRIPTQIGEVDRVLGGGLFPGSLILLGGDPGIGKSTLILQVCAGISSTASSPVLYISGEESIHQIGLRANRLKIKTDNLLCLSHSNIQTMIDIIKQVKPSFIVVDSIQTTYSPEMLSSIGSPQQLRAICAQFLDVAKCSQTIVCMIGHVTKDGGLAGPRVLEHMVDTVLSFEGAKDLRFRFLRTTKNRFGSTDEVGVFTMKEQGLSEVQKPSLLFLSAPTGISGTSVTCFLDGTRPFLIEVQALSCKSYGQVPLRKCSGLDANRISVLLAVAERKLDIQLYKYDIFFSVTGGVRIQEPSIDLALFFALFSSIKNKPIPAKTLILGEIGLGGEVRPIPHLMERIREGSMMGFENFLVPDQEIEDFAKKDAIALQIKVIKDISSALKLLQFF